MIVIEDSYLDVKSKLSSTPDVGTYHLFDRVGQLFASDRNSIGYEEGPKVFLKQLLRNEYLDMSDFIPENGNINNLEWFHDINRLFESSEKKFNVVSLFTSICNTCFSGSIIRALNEIWKEKYSSFFVLGILNDQKFSTEDKNILKSQIEADFPFIIAESKLSQRWNNLISEFRETDFDQIVFITDCMGNIIRVFHKNCDCGESFFQFLKSLN